MQVELRLGLMFGILMPPFDNSISHLFEEYNDMFYEYFHRNEPHAILSHYTAFNLMFSLGKKVYYIFLTILDNHYAE